MENKWSMALILNLRLEPKFYSHIIRPTIILPRIILLSFGAGLVLSKVITQNRLLFWEAFYLCLITLKTGMYIFYIKNLDFFVSSPYETKHIFVS